MIETNSVLTTTPQHQGTSPMPVYEQSSSYVQENWLFSNEDFLHTPSLRHAAAASQESSRQSPNNGPYSLEEEKRDRAKGCQFIHLVGNSLSL